MYNMGQFYAHAKNMCDGTDGNNCEDVAHLLRFWRQNKEEYLYDLLGQELIVSKPVSYERDQDEMYREMEEVKNCHWQFFRDIRNNLENVLHPIWTDYEAVNSDAKFIDNFMNLFDCGRLVDGRVQAFQNNSSAIIMGREVRLSTGQKSMRAIGRVAELLNMQQQFEDFRIAHSQVLNQKLIKGTLHLSIHPLDYATASDNVNDWDSCMSWLNEGCCRMGTVEMMNSPMVICAYLSGKNTMDGIGGEDWNSKKWRAWAIVNKDVILVNRQYPYHNDNIGIAVVDWIKELAQKNLGWSYGETEARLDYSAYGFSFDCGYMYNDISGCHAGCVASHIQKNTVFHHHNHSVWFSGPAECMWCGREIKWDEGNDSGTLTCPECHGATRCVCCGEVVYGDYAYWGPDDQPYCSDCYSDNFTNCEHCDDIVPQEEAISLEFPIVQHTMTKYIQETPVGSSARSKYTFNYVPNSLTTNICKDCLRNLTGKHVHDIVLHNIDYPRNHSLFFTSMGCCIDPTKVSFDQFLEIFRPYPRWRHDDGSIREVWMKLWEDYIKHLTSIGRLEF